MRNATSIWTKCKTRRSRFHLKRCLLGATAAAAAAGAGAGAAAVHFKKTARISAAAFKRKSANFLYIFYAVRKAKPKAEADDANVCKKQSKCYTEIHIVHTYILVVSTYAVH